MILKHIRTGFAEQFAGRWVDEFDPAVGILYPARVAYRLRVDRRDEDSFSDKLLSLLQDPQAPNIETLLIGAWDRDVASWSSCDAVTQLVRAKDRLPNLSALFIGDIISDESEMSWIQQSDMTPLLDAYANLVVFGARGGSGLSFSSLRHEKLRQLQVEATHLRPYTIDDICEAHLPNLEYLELWLGAHRYGEPITLEDMAPIISGKLFPKLTYLGLLNSEIADEIALALVNAPIMKQIERLELSMGMMGDEGGHALAEALTGSSVEWLNISENFLSHKTIERLEKLPITVVNRYQDEEGAEPEYRYVSVAE